jgi:hypothetical protein
MAEPTTLPLAFAALQVDARENRFVESIRVAVRDDKIVEGLDTDLCLGFPTHRIDREPREVCEVRRLRDRQVRVEREPVEGEFGQSREVVRAPRRGIVWLRSLCPAISAGVSPAKSGKNHEVVEIAEMADPEHLARDLRQTGAERQIIAAESGVDHIGAVEARRDDDRGHRIGIPFRFLRAGLQAPGLDRGAHAAC